jgi:RNA polymerase sigma-70 factor (ECF subfamily)
VSAWLLAGRRERSRAALGGVADAQRAGGEDGDVDGESSLIERLARGDESALHEAYRQHRPVLLRFARRLVGDGPSADDLVHEVFVRLPRAIRRLQPGTPLGAFLVAVALNHARHHVRSAARRRRTQARLALEPRPPSGGAPDGELERRQLAAALTTALDRLPIDQRIAFVLCTVEERTSVDAAALAGTNESTMRARLFHARRKLREQLADYQNGGCR